MKEGTLDNVRSTPLDDAPLRLGNLRLKNSLIGHLEWQAQTRHTLQAALDAGVAALVIGEKTASSDASFLDWISQLATFEQYARQRGAYVVPCLSASRYAQHRRDIDQAGLSALQISVTKTSIDELLESLQRSDLSIWLRLSEEQIHPASLQGTGVVLMRDAPAGADQSAHMEGHLRRLVSQGLEISRLIAPAEASGIYRLEPLAGPTGLSARLHKLYDEITDSWKMLAP
ncbi:hypothetical protein [Pseudomonas sp. LRF_L74]|uniref:hypothetical protein n=1 Tax=Pseudomonas sp. LRF_L74 TaxID=3369422 RepID=UPI003F60EE47